MSPRSRFATIRNVILVNAVALVAAVYVFEIGATVLQPRWFSNVMVRAVPEGAHRATFDRRTAPAVVLEIRQTEGVRAYPLPSRPTVDEIFRRTGGFPAGVPRPLAGVSRVVTVLCGERGPYTRYTSDRFGFNNPDSVWNGPVAIALLGDSFMQGNCVTPDSTVAAVLRRGGRRAVSLGISGNGPVSMLAAQREFAGTLRPRVIGWAHYEGNDLCDLNDELRDSALTPYFDAAYQQRLVARQADVDRALRDAYESQLQRLEGIYGTKTWAWRNVLTLSQLRTVLTESRFTARQTSSPQCGNLAAFRRVLEQAQRDAKALGAELVFIYLPSSRWIPAPEDELVRRHGAVLDTVRALGLRVIDLTPDMRAAGAAERVWDFPMSHYTAHGYAMVAAAIERALGDQFRQ